MCMICLEDMFIMEVTNKVSLVLVIIGAINWLLIGVFGYDLVGAVFGGQMAIMSRVVFTLVGLAGLWCISLLFAHNRAVSHS